MSALREAAQQALEALEELRVWRIKQSMAVTALRAALAQEQAEPEQESVVWAGYDLDSMAEAFSRVIEAHHSNRHPFHNPLDMDARMALRILRGFLPAMKAFTAPPRRTMVPLTEEDLGKLYADWYKTPAAGLAHFARAVEKAIWEKNK